MKQLETSELQTGWLASLLPAEWFVDQAAASAWVRVYSIVYLSNQALDRILDGLRKRSWNRKHRKGEEVFIAFGRPEGLRMLRTDVVTYSDDAGDVHVELKLNQLPLKPT